ncbi:MAG: hypothetical protein AAF380_01115 [Bacteroidota bacterium]
MASQKACTKACQASTHRTAMPKPKKASQFSLYCEPKYYHCTFSNGS